MQPALPSNLRLARLRLGLTQIVVAARAGFSPSRLSLIERDLVAATQNERITLSAILAVPVTDLFPGGMRP